MKQPSTFFFTLSLFSFFGTTGKKLLLLLSLLIGFSAIANAQTIKGSVTDAKSGDVLIGATVHIQKDNIQLNTTVKLDGSYIFKNVAPGTYKLRVSFIGYNTTKEYSVEVA